MTGYFRERDSFPCHSYAHSPLSRALNLCPEVEWVCGLRDLRIFAARASLLGRPHDQRHVVSADLVLFKKGLMRCSSFVSILRLRPIGWYEERFDRHGQTAHNSLSIKDDLVVSSVAHLLLLEHPFQRTCRPCAIRCERPTRLTNRVNADVLGR